MTVIFSKKCELGLQAVLYLSTLEQGKTASAIDISKKMNVPKEFVAKVLQSLTASGIVDSKKGKSGGFFLARPASDIRLIDIVKAIDGLSVFEKCVLGFPGCTIEKPCPLHYKWGRIRDEAFAMLSTETLKDLNESTIIKIKSLENKITEGEK